MKLHFRSLVSIALSAALLLGCVGCGGAPKAATTITVWTYYSGDQLTSFNELVDEFNSTVGQEKHIVVKSSSQGSVTDLETNVLAAAKGEVGAAALPNIYSGYADMAYDLDQLGEVVDLAPYLTDKEKAAYVDGFLKEGDLMNNGELKVFPVAKSTELFYLNATDWAPFAAATGVTYDDLATVEGVTEAAHKYYDWTDAQTDTPNDGKAFFGRDALANYLFCGAQELGVTIFDAENGVMTLNLDKDVMRKLWDNYYVPFLKGWFGASGRFRSDDMKTGNLLSYVGSSSSSTFFPKQVLTSDTESHDIEMAVLPCPSFSGCAPVAAQQGAGMIVTKGTDAQIEASVEFLKWFTQPHRLLGQLRLPARDPRRRQSRRHPVQRAGAVRLHHHGAGSLAECRGERPPVHHPRLPEGFHGPQQIAVRHGGRRRSRPRHGRGADRRRADPRRSRGRILDR